MHLCRTVFHCSVAEAKRRVTYREFLLWAAAYQQSPWGDDWDQTATIVCTMANLWSKKRIRPSDVIPGNRNRELNRRKALYEKLKQQHGNDRQDSR